MWSAIVANEPGNKNNLVKKTHNNNNNNNNDLCAAQEQALRSNYIKHHNDKSIDSPLCRMCGKCGESVQHIVSGCEKLAQKEYKRRHDNVAKMIHWDLCKKHGLEHQEKWYDHIPEGGMTTFRYCFFIHVSYVHMKIIDE